jgi:hypothetical protein
MTMGEHENNAAHPPDSTGCVRPVEEHVTRTEAPLSCGWITPALQAKTRELWSRKYGRELTDDDAVEILVNVKTFVDVMLRLQKECEEEGVNL